VVWAGKLGKFSPRLGTFAFHPTASKKFGSNEKYLGIKWYWFLEENHFFYGSCGALLGGNEAGNLKVYFLGNKFSIKG